MIDYASIPAWVYAALAAQGSQGTTHVQKKKCAPVAAHLATSKAAQASPTAGRRHMHITFPPRSLTRSLQKAKGILARTCHRLGGTVVITAGHVQAVRRQSGGLE